MSKRQVSQRELRNDSGAIMAAVDRGESFTVTRNGVPVAELRPVERRRFVSAARVVASMAGAPPIDARRYQTDVDAAVDQRGAPRA